MPDQRRPEDYVVALIDPLFLSDEVEPAAAGVGLLIVGQIEVYDRRKTGLGLPGFAELSGTEPSDAGIGLLRGIALLTTGGDEGLTVLQKLALDDGTPSDVSAAASVLAAVALRRSGRPDLAGEVIRTRLARGDLGHLSEAFLRLHLGIELAAAGSFDAAVDETGRVATLVADGPAMETIVEIAKDNYDQFS